jgi:hypothetical protein
MGDKILEGQNVHEHTEHYTKHLQLLAPLLAKINYDELDN